MHLHKDHACPKLGESMKLALQENQLKMADGAFACVFNFERMCGHMGLRAGFLCALALRGEGGGKFTMHISSLTWRAEQ